MTVRYIPGVPPKVTPPPGAIEINWTLTEDEFLLLRGLMGKTRGFLLDRQYYEGVDTREQLDPNMTRTRALLDTYVIEVLGK